MIEKGCNNIMEQVHELLTKFQTAKNREKSLRNNAETIASQLAGVVEGLRKHPASVVLGEDLPSKVANITADLREVQTEINTLTYSLKEIYGLSDIVNAILKD